MRCDDLALDSVLREVDEDNAAYQAVVKHVETCPHCQQRLADLSAADDLTREACETLRERGETSLDAHPGPSSIAISVERLASDQEPVDCQTISLDFLESGRHPEMLGRIGRYDVERVIGAGGMGIVLKGFDTELHRVVAIKALLPHLATSAAARRRFAREAQAAAAVVHQHVIPIYNVESDAKVPFLVMQLVSGDPLQARVDAQGPLEVKDVLRIARQAAAGLAAAHAQGVIHRDVKPANILLEESVDRVLISDFGLARMADDATLTRTGTLAGTPHYMSPEQASGLAIDHRTDLFSLGSVIYFMCTGRPPFRAESSMAVLNRICHEPHTPIDQINPELPLELVELVDRLLAKEPSGRFATAAEIEEYCSSLLASIQQGRRLRRRRGRLPLRNRNWIWRAAVLEGALVIGLVAGSSFVFPRVEGPSQPRPTDAPEQSQASDEIPPDTFADDVAAVHKQLDAIETQNAGHRSMNLMEDRWPAEIADIDQKLKLLEAAATAFQVPAEQAILSPESRKDP